MGMIRVLVSEVYLSRQEIESRGATITEVLLKIQKVKKNFKIKSALLKIDESASKDVRQYEAIIIKFETPSTLVSIVNRLETIFDMYINNSKEE